jgi:hypothetical protein
MVPNTAVQGPYIKETDVSKNIYCAVQYSAGMLIVSHAGDYRVTITNASGRTVKAFGGKGTSRFAFSNKTYGSGVYIVAFHSATGVAKRRVIVY